MYKSTNCRGLHPETVTLSMLADNWCPRRPTIVRLWCLRLAQSLMALSASRKLSCLGTRLRMASVTRQPFRLRTHLGSRFLSRETSRRLRLWGMAARARRENSRSIWREGGTTESYTAVSMMSVR